MNLLSSRPILSPPTILNFPLNHPVFMSIYQKKYSTNNSSASPVFLIHVSIAISYHSSHNVMFKFLMNITYLLNYTDQPNFSILSASNNSIKVKVKIYLYKPKRYKQVEVQLHSFLNLAIDEGKLSILCPIYILSATWFTQKRIFQRLDLLQSSDEKVEMHTLS
jgi:hypothetical protein